MKNIVICKLCGGNHPTGSCHKKLDVSVGRLAQGVTSRLKTIKSKVSRKIIK